MPIQPETNGNRPVTDLSMEKNDSRASARAVSCSQAEDTNFGRLDAMAPLVSYGGHGQQTRDVPADNIPPHPTGVDETIIVEDGVNQAGTAPLRGQVVGIFNHSDGTREVHVSTQAALDDPALLATSPSGLSTAR